MRAILSACLLALAVVGCADLNTVSRRTTLPPSGDDKNHGVAIHLDAQQRLAFVGSNGDYCAEPSPDALAAYASALGLSAGVRNQGTGALSAAQQSFAASIGLRTQSITLMRDALYRLCEARAQGRELTVAENLLLLRSQDLTAVVVAVEQLTGAVAANQVTLGGKAHADAAANLAGNQQALDAANKDVASKETRLGELKDNQTTQNKAAKDAQDALTKAEGELAKKPDDPALKEAVTKATAERDKQKAAKEKLDKDVELQTQAAADANEVRDLVESTRNAARAQAAASTSGDGQFSSVTVQQPKIDANTAKYISSAVENMVTTVLAKQYTAESCNTLLTNERLLTLPNIPKNLETVLKACVDLVAAKVMAEEKIIKSTYGRDPNSDILQKELETNPAFRPRLVKWLADRLPGVSVAFFVTGDEYKTYRAAAISDLLKR